MIVSSHTEFINDGSRNNRGINVAVTNDDSIQKRGVIIGVVGSRQVYYLLYIYIYTIVCKISIQFIYNKLNIQDLNVHG